MVRFSRLILIAAVGACGAKDVTSSKPDGSALDAGTTAQPTTVGSGGIRISALAIDEANVYWLGLSALGGVFKAPKSGGATSRLDDVPTGTEATSIGVDSTSVYLPCGGEIISIPTAGGGAVSLATATASGVAVVDGNVYWTETDGGSIVAKSVPTAGGPIKPIPLPENSETTASSYIRASADAVYASLATSILRIPIDGSAPRFFPASRPGALATDSSSVYFAMTTSIASVPKGGGTVTTLTSGADITGLDVDDAFLYFADSGRILKVSKNGGAPTLLADDPSCGARDVAVDASSVYWDCSSVGTIEKIAKN